MLNVAANPSVICSGESATLTANGANTYSWTSIGNDSSIVVSPTTSITYTVSGANSFGCIKTDTIYLIVSPCIGIEEIYQDEKVIFYPNPATNYLSITMAEKFNAELFTVNGERLLVSNNYDSQATFDISHLSQGVYLLRIQSQDKCIVKKWIKN